MQFWALFVIEIFETLFILVDVSRSSDLGKVWAERRYLPGSNLCLPLLFNLNAPIP